MNIKCAKFSSWCMLSFNIEDSFKLQRFWRIFFPVLFSVFHILHLFGKNYWSASITMKYSWSIFCDTLWSQKIFVLETSDYRYIQCGRYKKEREGSTKGSERRCSMHFIQRTIIVVQWGSGPSQVQGWICFVMGSDTWLNLVGGQPCCQHRSVALQSEKAGFCFACKGPSNTTWPGSGQTCHKGPAQIVKENISWQMSELRFFSMSALLCAF